jgi:hypothetical protein
VAHAYNPSYSGGRDQEDLGLKPVQANSSETPYLKKPFTKTGLEEWLKVKHQYLKKTNLFLFNNLKQWFSRLGK